MARKTATYIRCDCPGCNELAEVENLRDNPGNWYSICKYDDLGKASGSFEFHALGCIETWASLRAAALEANRQTPVRPAEQRLAEAVEQNRAASAPTESNRRPANGKASRGFKSRGKRGVAEQCREAILLYGDAEFSAPEIAELTGAHSSTARTVIHEMVKGGEARVVHWGGGNGNPHRYKLALQLQGGSAS